MNIKKIIAIFTLSCFIFSFVTAEALLAAADGGIAVEEQFKLASDELIISPANGRITDSSISQYASTPLVINIQDLHCHAEVQRNIAKILAALDDKYGLDKVYVEGGYGDINTSWLSNVKDEQLKKDIAGSLVGLGRLTGSEYYSITAGRPGLLKGIEDQALHRQNIVRLGKILDSKAYFEGKIKELDKSLQFMKARHLNSGNRKFNKIIAKHREGGIRGDKYYRLLAGYADAINKNPDKFNAPLGITMADYPEIIGYIELTQAATKLKHKRISRQLQVFMRELKSKLPYGVYSDLLAKTDNFSNTDELYIYLAQLSKTFFPPAALSRFPDLRLYFDYTEKNRDINPIKMLDEEKRLIEEIRIGLSKDVSELEVSFLADFFGCFQDYLLNKLSADDYEYFVRRFEKFKIIWSKYAFSDKISGLSGDFAVLDEYYKVNSDRNECFVRSMEELRGAANVARGNNKALPRTIHEALSNSDIIVMITGGFHSEGLKKLLGRRGISYLTITPNVTKDAAISSALYTELAKKQAKMFSKSSLPTLSSPGLAGRSGNNSLALALTDLKVVLITRDKIVLSLDGEQMILSRNGRNTFDLPQSAVLSNPLIDKAALELAVTEAARLASKIRTLPNQLLSVELVYQLVKTFSVWAGRNDMFDSNGLIWRIASNTGVQAVIAQKESISPEDLSQLSDHFQEIIKGHAVRQDRLAEIAKGNALISAIVNVPGVRDFIKGRESNPYPQYQGGAVDEAILNKVLELYDIGKNVIEAGTLRDNVFLIRTDKGSFVFKKPRYRNNDGLVGYEASIVGALEGAGMRASRILPARSGNYTSEIGGDKYVLYEYLPGRSLHWGEVDGVDLEASAATLAKIHDVLKDFHPAGREYHQNELPPVIGIFNMNERLEKLERLLIELRRRGPPYSNVEKLCFDNLQNLQHNIETIRRNITPAVVDRLPQTIIHGDYHQDNLVFYARGRAKPAVVDWEYARKDARVRDLANGCITESHTDGTSLGAEKIRKFIAAYQANTNTPLTPDELSILPDIYRLWYLEIILLNLEMYNDNTLYPNARRVVTEQVENLKLIDSIDWGNIVEVPAALTLSHTYTLGRFISGKVLRFALGSIGYQPAIVTEQNVMDRWTELVVAPFIAVWDIVVHTLKLIIAAATGSLKPDGDYYRIAGAGIIWTATWLAWQLTGDIPITYLANASTHAIYNLFFGAGTKANAPLTVKKDARGEISGKSGTALNPGKPGAGAVDIDYVDEITKAFPGDITMGFELYFLVSDQLKLSRGSTVSPEQADSVLNEIKKVLPPHWELVPGKGASNGMSYEIKTWRDAGIPYQNLPSDWRNIIRGIQDIQKALPGGFYVIHMHTGQISKTKDERLNVNYFELARIVKVYEAMWRALAGRGYSRALYEGPARAQQSFDYSPRALALRGKVETLADSAVLDIADSRDHVKMIHVCDEHPDSIEVKIVDGLLNESRLLDIGLLIQNIWWIFSLTEFMTKKQVNYDEQEEMPLVLLGNPVVAGQKPGQAQIDGFIELFYANDPVGRALAYKQFSTLGNEPAGMEENEIIARERRMEHLYELRGLGEIYRLHKFHGGRDKNIESDLLNPPVLRKMAGDLIKGAEYFGEYPAADTRQMKRIFTQKLRNAIALEFERIKNEKAFAPVNAIVDELMAAYSGKYSADIPRTKLFDGICAVFGVDFKSEKERDALVPQLLEKFSRLPPQERKNVKTTIIETLPQTTWHASAAHRFMPLALAAGKGFRRPNANKLDTVLLAWHYVKSSGLAGVVDKFGAAVVDDNGREYINMYIVKEMPESGGDWDWKNFGINVNGKTVWVAVKDGALVFFVDGVDGGDAIHAVNEAITNKGNIAGGRRLTRRLRRLLKSANVDLKAAGFNTGLIVDHAASGKEMHYSKDGSMVVSGGVFEEMPGMRLRDSISVKLGELMAVRNSESFVMGRSNSLYLDIDRNSGKEAVKKKLIENIRVSDKTMGAMIIIDDFVINMLGEDAIGKMSELARKNGVEICVNCGQAAADGDRYIEMGFIYSENAGNKFLIHTLDDKIEESDIISGYETMEQLRSMYGKSGNINKTLKSSELARLMKGGERDMLELIGITEFFRTMILSMHSADVIDREYVRNVAHSFARNSLAVSEADLDILVQAACKGNAFMAIKDKKIGCANTYLEKMKLDLEKAGRTDEIPALSEEFSKAVIERMLALNKLKNVELADFTHEKILGQKLLLQRKFGTATEGATITAESFTEQYGNYTPARFYGRLNLKIKELCSRPENDAAAINALIELIPSLAERKMKQENIKKEQMFNADSVGDTLKAA